jgi:hypothetical protein
VQQLAGQDVEGGAGEDDEVSVGPAVTAAVGGPETTGGTESAAPGLSRAGVRVEPGLVQGQASADPARRDAAPAAVKPPIVADPQAAEVADRHAVAVAVNRMTLQRSTHAEVDIPELGRIGVTARTHQKEVEVSVTAPAHSVGVLRAAGGELSASLRDASIPLGSLRIGADGAGAGAGAGGGGSAERDGRGEPRGQQQDRPNAEADAPQRRRVRFVL